MTETLSIDLADPRLVEPRDGDLVVLVEPLYGGVAVAAALDAGWGEVELAPLAGPPIPLISYEQSPPPGHRNGRCRVRTDDLVDSAWFVLERSGEVELLLGTPANARPICAQLALRPYARVLFVPVLAEGQPAIDATWACGMLIRVLLDELDVRDARLTEAAGIAVTLATGTEDAHHQLATGERWRQHVAAGGAADDARIAAAVDSIGVVPCLQDADGVLVARPWMPPLVATPAAGLPANQR
ncbi:MAG: hypothetical protein JWM25_779 [Thermoleophilia bacterium]|nr:hypothetical protein [Thermoleophilia bacterium]MCZ4496196.1 hypothetical protein [Thermoleophilia bacterium]